MYAPNFQGGIKLVRAIGQEALITAVPVFGGPTQEVISITNAPASLALTGS